MSSNENEILEGAGAHIDPPVEEGEKPSDLNVSRTDFDSDILNPHVKARWESADKNKDGDPHDAEEGEGRLFNLTPRLSVSVLKVAEDAVLDLYEESLLEIVVEASRRLALVQSAMKWRNHQSKPAIPA
jgi:hypothetical protein